MKLATVSSQNPLNRNGDLIVVSSDNRKAVRSTVANAATMVEALQNWRTAGPELEAIAAKLNRGGVDGSFDLDLKKCLAPLPNAPGFYDGSAFLSHVVRARRSRGDQMPESAKVTPLMYQGVSDNLLSAYVPIPLPDVAWGGDLEGEFAAITTDVPSGTTAEKAEKYIALFSLFNDITMREIVKVEIETKFGFLQSKPNSSFAPLVVTPDELGRHWDGKRISLDVVVNLNGKLLGNPNGSEMHFSFGQLIAHACRTRPLSAGSIVGTGTVSNEDQARGFTCLTEKRFQEVIDTGKPVTPWLQPGDRVTIDVQCNGVSLFGEIDQVVATP